MKKYGASISPPPKEPKDIAQQKAAAAYSLFPQDCILTADTIVVNEWRKVLFKPRSVEEAVSFLRRRSGSAEEIITGFCLRYNDEVYLSSDISYIKYGDIPLDTQKEIIRSNEWRDVCGGLKIEGIIAPYIDEIKGSRNNIMGLPTEKLIPLLERLQLVKKETL